jgi:hypothetical protein
MSVFVLSAITAASSSGDDIGFARYLIPGISVAIGLAIVGWFFNRRAKENTDAVSGGAVNAFGFVIAPASPLVDTLTQLRELVGDTSPMPTISRFSRPVVTVDEAGIKVGEKKPGVYLTIAAADIVSVEAGPAKHKPALVPMTLPSIWFGVRHDGKELKLPFAPIVSANQTTRAQALALAAEISARLGLPQA